MVNWKKSLISASFALAYLLLLNPLHSFAQDENGTPGQTTVDPASSGLLACSAVSEASAANGDEVICINDSSSAGKAPYLKAKITKKSATWPKTGEKVKVKFYAASVADLKAAGLITVTEVTNAPRGGSNCRGSACSPGGGGTTTVVTSRGGGRGSPGVDRGRAAANKAQQDLDALKDLCNQLPDMISERQDDIDKANDDLKKALADLASAKADEKDARKAMETSCRNRCISQAIGDGPCHVDADALANQLGPKDLDRVSTYYSGQENNINTIRNNTGVDSAGVCAAMIGKLKFNPEKENACLKMIVGDKATGLGCPAADDGDWMEAYKVLAAKTAAIAEAQARVAAYQDKSVSCKLTAKTAKDLDKWTSCNTKCLETAFGGCPDVLTDANTNVTTLNQQCATCGTGEGRGGGGGGGGGGGSGSSCTYGGCVSHAAQIVGAAGYALGQLTPLGLGIMNSINYAKGTNACTQGYSQMLNVYTNVGIAPPPPNCGIMGAMGGFSGGMGYGSSMFNSSGIPGIAGGSYPYMAGGGIGAYGGIGMGMGGYPGGMGYPGAYTPGIGGMGMGQTGIGGVGNQYNDSLQRSQMLGIIGQGQQLGAMNNYGLTQQGQYGAYSPYSSMYGMGAYNAYNPMSMYGGGGMYGASAYGAYSPYAPSAYYGGGGYGGGSGFNLSAGLNINAGSGGYGGYGGYPGYNAYTPGYNAYTPMIPGATTPFNAYQQTSCTIGTSC